MIRLTLRVNENSPFLLPQHGARRSSSPVGGSGKLECFRLTRDRHRPAAPPGQPEPAVVGYPHGEAGRRRDLSRKGSRRPAGPCGRRPAVPASAAAGRGPCPASARRRPARGGRRRDPIRPAPGTPRRPRAPTDDCSPGRGRPGSPSSANTAPGRAAGRAAASPPGRRCLRAGWRRATPAGPPGPSGVAVDSFQPVRSDVVPRRGVLHADGRAPWRGARLQRHASS